MLIPVAPMLTSCLCNSIAAQSDEGCRKDLFKTSQKKGVGYLLLITAFHFFPLVCVCRVQCKMPLHVTSAMTTLCNRSTLQSPHITFHPQKQQLNARSINAKEESPQSTRMVCLHTKDVAASSDI